MSRASARDRPGTEPSRQLRRSARRLVASPLHRHRADPARAVAGQLRGRRAARRRAARAAARGARRRSRRTPVFGTLLAGILVVLRPREARAAAALPHRRVPGARRRRRRSCFIGDAFHNFIDGAIICTAVMTSVPLGINTAIAVAAHEIPQEVGDVAILLAAGYSRGARAAAEHRVRRVGHRRRAPRVRRGRSHSRHPAVRARVLVGQPAVHRDVRSDSRSPPRRRSTRTRSARCC